MIGKKTFKNIWKSNFIRNVAIVASGSVGSQAILMAFSPFITRIYGPEAYGYQGIFITISNVLVPLAAMAYPMAIVLAKNNSEALVLTRLSVIISFLTASIISVIVFFSGSEILNLLNSSDILNFIWLIPLYVFFSGILQIVNQWRIRKKQFRATANILIFHSFLISSIKVGIGTVSPKGGTLISLSTFGVALQSMLMLFSMKDKELNNAILCNVATKPAHLLDIAKKYSDFPKFRTPQDFFSAITQSIPMLMLSSFFGPTTAGFYALARTILLMPISLLSKSVSDVIYPKISETYNNNLPIAPLIIKSTLGLAAIGIVPFGLVSLFGPTLFGIVFGEQWVVAGEYAQWLTIWLYFLFLNSPANVSFPVQGLLKFSMYLQFASTFFRVIALIIGFLILESDVYSIALFSLTGMVFNIILISSAIIFAKRHDSGLK